MTLIYGSITDYYLSVTVYKVSDGVTLTIGYQGLTRIRVSKEDKGLSVLHDTS